MSRNKEPASHLTRLQYPMTDFSNNPMSGPKRSVDEAALDFEHKDSDSSLTDEMLLLRVVERDQRAMKTLFDRYSTLVLSVAMRVLKDRELSEDLLQEVFLKLWRTPSAYVAKRGALGAWLHVVARNRAIDILRRRRTTTSVDDYQLASTFDLASDIERTVIAEKVRGVMTSLPQEQRNALDLAYFEGLSHSEISERTGSPLGTVKTRVRSALTTLRKALQG